MTGFVKFPVRRRVSLGKDTEDTATVDDDRELSILDPQRREVPTIRTVITSADASEFIALRMQSCWAIGWQTRSAPGSIPASRSPPLRAPT